MNQYDDDDKKVAEEDLTEEDLTLLGAGDDDDDDADEDEDTTSDPAVVPTANVVQAREVLVTKEGLKKLQDELELLEGTRRKEVAQRLKEAISYGDLSENSEYEDAKNEQAFVEGRINEVRDMIKNAKIISENSGKTKTVKIGSTVTVKNLTEKEPDETYTIVGSTEADPLAAKISNESPIGAAVIDRAEGDEVIVKAPAGEFKYKIVKVS